MKVDEGQGRPILVLHGGMGNLGSWARVTDRLHDRFRTVRLHRRQYRLEVPRKVTIADEVAEVREAAAALIGPGAGPAAGEGSACAGPVPGSAADGRAVLGSVADRRPVLVGHSSGAVVALEALVADPGLYSAAVLYEPPIVVDEVLSLGVAPRARAALEAGRAGTAFAIFLRDVARMRSPMVGVAEFVMNRKGAEMGPLVERQWDDGEAIDALGNRLAAYGQIAVPVLLLGGSRSPRHLIDRLDALEGVLPNGTRMTMRGLGHTAERTAPGRVAAAVSGFL
ncbi:alpha/beta fold hydrolase [Paractinoplanes atraurantiacus]|uniref:Pimeloyl-ACP methyl ester carboxylesterase n=1 Tax=Paractinoplanes atraurantiacus TaxID=1036182 RepID=A0A285FJZ0_9ACTN|nr:alpha/beta hydrolase [Actinoplanes atraurantiacus]SNY11538.1 Pimeloyl-ACP methyl ester carboxylesterase [Actinoplanes atraurantiacus]